MSSDVHDMLCSSVDTKPGLATLSCFKHKDKNDILDEIIDDIAAKLRQVGRCLNFQASTLNNIESTHNGGVEKCTKS